MGRWTQFDEDSSRLPEGVTRVAYDADTHRYTFRTDNGELLIGRPGEVYGKMSPLSDSIGHVDDEGNIHVCPPSPSKNGQTSPQTRGRAKSFRDIIDSSYIGTAPESPAESSRSQILSGRGDKGAEGDPTASIGKLAQVVRRNTLPRMQNVARQAMRRTGTISKRYTRIDSISEKV